MATVLLPEDFPESSSANQVRAPAAAVSVRADRLRRQKSDHDVGATGRGAAARSGHG